MNIQWLKALGDTSYGRFAAHATESINKNIVGRDLFLAFEKHFLDSYDIEKLLKDLWEHQRTFLVFSFVMLFLTFLYLIALVPIFLSYIYSTSASRKPKRYWKKPIMSLAVPILVSACIVLLGLITCFGAHGLMDHFVEEFPKDRMNYKAAVEGFVNRSGSNITAKYMNGLINLETEINNAKNAGKHVSPNVNNYITKSKQFIQGTTFHQDIINFISSRGLDFDNNIDFFEPLKKINTYRSWAFFIYLVIYLLVIILLSFGAFSSRPLFSLSATFLIIMTFLLCLYAHINYTSGSVVSSLCSGGSPSEVARIILKTDQNLKWEALLDVCSDPANNIIDALHSAYQKETDNEIVGNMTIYSKDSSSPNLVRLSDNHPTGFYIEYNVITKSFFIEYPNRNHTENEMRGLGQDVKDLLDGRENVLKDIIRNNLLECQTVSDALKKVHYQVCHNGRNSFNSMNSGLYAVIIFVTIALILSPSIVRRMRKRKLIYDPKADLE